MPSSITARSTWQRFADRSVGAFHTYASWLVSISWKKFFLLAVLLMIVASVLEQLPPFSWKTTETVIDTPDIPQPPKPPKPPRVSRGGREGVEISIDERGVRITQRGAAAAASAASAASAAEAAASMASQAAATLPEVLVRIPPGADTDRVKEAIEEARQSVLEAVEEAKQAAQEAAQEAAEAAREADEEGRPLIRTRHVHAADFLTDLAFFWIVASAILKLVYKGRLQAEVKAAQATETAEAEQLRRQVLEARMAAMQAQVEPHFLFNTLASIDHLIETDPPRASTMQKNLIALLRASMPTMREASGAGTGVRDLGRELAVIRPYLEILKVRMEERLATDIDVPEGLHSAEFPPMMIQSLVENAIKHGLEPKAEGGRLSVKAQIVHGKLAVTVADTGLGFGKAATAGTGVGLENIRERLKLLYGSRGSLTVAENPGGGTAVTITVPYTARTEEAATA